MELEQSITDIGDQDEATGQRQLQRAVGAVEQLHPEGCLKVADLLRGGGQAQADPARAVGQRPGLRRGVEEFQSAKRDAFGQGRHRGLRACHEFRKNELEVGTGQAPARMI